ncbi:MAG: recombination mediator RecR [Spirochaetales bacterium]
MGPLENLIVSLGKLPGLGKKSAVRMAFHLLKADRAYLTDLGRQLSTLKDTVRRCSVCGTWTEADPCDICSDLSRDRSTLCVVEQVQDLMNLHATGEFRGLFHVLHGVIAPLDGIGPAELGLDRLERRVAEGGIREIILATNPTLEGDTTALYIHRMLGHLGVRLTRLASGLPVGGDLEYADRLTIARSLKARTVVE